MPPGSWAYQKARSVVSTDSRLIGGLLVIAALWIVFHGYMGIVHDSRLYLLLALARISPELYSQDLFMTATQQSKYTLFPALLSTAVEGLGVERAFMTLLVIGHVLWLSGLVRLFIRLSNGAAFWLGLAVVVCVPSTYHFDVLSYGEGFVTPRIFAEALILFALASAVRRVSFKAFLLSAVAGLFHPLVAIGGLGMVTVIAALRDARWLVLPAAALPAILLAGVLEIPPFNSLFLTVDETWMELIRQRNAMVVVSEWRGTDWVNLLFTTGVCLASLSLAQRPMSHLIVAVLAISLLSVVISYLAGDLQRNMLVIQLQLWRSIWILQVVANFLMGYLSIRLLQTGREGLALIVIIWILWLVRDFGAVTLLTSAAIFGVTHVVMRVRRRADSLAYFSFVLVALGLTVMIWMLGVAQWWSSQGWSSIEPAGVTAKAVFFVFRPLYLVGILAALMLYRMRDRLPRSGLVALGVIAVSIAFIFSDQRADWSRFVERNPFSLRTFAEFVSPGQSVFWNAGPLETWLLLGRSSYMSRLQGAGLLFSNELASEYARRAAAVNPVSNLNFFRPDHPEKGYSFFSAISPGDMFGVCRSAPDLDFVVLEKKLGKLSVEHWQAPIGRRFRFSNGESTEVRTFWDFFLYDCGAIRQMSISHPSVGAS